MTAKRGFTLIEMLVVVSIMMILVAVAVRVLPSSKESAVREAARAVNVYISSARNRAMEIGRPCGVMLRRFSATVPCAMTLDQCEVPPCYAGDTEQSVATVTQSGTTITATLGTDGPLNLLRNGDLIQFNFQGPQFAITNPNGTDGFIPAPSSGPWTLTCDTGGALVPWNGQTAPYRIYRSPAKSGATPLQLPAATVVDLGASGIDFGASFNPSPPGDIIVLFAPHGGIETVYISGVKVATVNPIFLLVGQRERIGNAFVLNNSDAATRTNYQELTNMWVTVNPQSGFIGTEVIGADPAMPSGGVISNVSTSRELARAAIGAGGR